jgi:hypothetical protein
MKTTTLLTTLLVTVCSLSVEAATGYPYIDSINVSREDSTGYYGYLVATPGAPIYFHNALLDYLPQVVSQYAAPFMMEGLRPASAAREQRGLPDLLQNYQLDIAAMGIVREIFRQDWEGVNFPDGKNLAYFLRQAGWTGDPSHVIAIVRARPNVVGTFFYADSLNPGYAIHNFPQLINPAFVTIGYAIGSGTKTKWVKTQGGGYVANVTDEGRVDGYYYDAVLLSTDAVPVHTEAMYNLRTLFEYFNHRNPDFFATTVIGRKGVRLNPVNLVATSKQLVGRARIKGHLPPGVHFNGHTGRFSGKPRKAGTRRVQITATYRLVGGEGATGTHTTRAVIRIRR